MLSPDTTREKAAMTTAKAGPAVGYPRLLRRIQALMIDGIIVPVLVIGLLIAASSLGVQGIYAGILVGVTVFVFEPLLVTVTGGTLGHHLLGMGVRQRRTGENLNIFAASLRFILKVVLGLPSLVSVVTARQHQALHDLVVGSIVVVREPSTKPAHEVLTERTVEDPHFTYPSKARRFLMMLLYGVVLMTLLGVILSLVLSEYCLMYGQCTGGEQAITAVLQLLWLLGAGAAIYFCWHGRLLGCRRQARVLDVAGD